jgi:hypothetical protein
MILLLLPLTAIMGYLTFRLKKLVWKQDKIIPIMFGVLTINLVIWILWYIFCIIAALKIEWQYGGSASYGCTAIIMT